MKWRALAAFGLGTGVCLAVACGDDDSAPSMQQFATTDSGSDVTVITPIPKADSSTPIVDAGLDDDAEAGPDGGPGDAVWQVLAELATPTTGDKVIWTGVAADATDRIYTVGWSTGPGVSPRPLSFDTDAGPRDAGAIYGHLLLVAWDGPGVVWWRDNPAIGDQPVVTTDANNNVTFAARFSGIANFGTVNRTDQTAVASYTHDGVARWDIALPASVYPYAIATGPNDTTVIGGSILNTPADLGGGVRQPGPFVLALGPNGAYKWDRTLASPYAQDVTRGVAVRSNEQVTAAGNVLDAGFVITYSADGGDVIDASIGQVVSALRFDQNGAPFIGVATGTSTHIMALNDGGGTFWDVPELVGDYHAIVNGGAFAVAPNQNLWTAPESDIAFGVTEHAFATGAALRKLAAGATAPEYQINGATILSNGDPVVVGGAEIGGRTAGYMARLHRP
jgi:hypothetical protein